MKKISYEMLVESSKEVLTEQEYNNYRDAFTITNEIVTHFENGYYRKATFIKFNFSNQNATLVEIRKVS